MVDQALINTKHTRVKFSVYSSCIAVIVLYAVYILQSCAKWFRLDHKCQFCLEIKTQFLVLK